MKTPRLGVNIDHVATLRQQRGESYPAVQRAAELALSSGADQITVHLREDRRHIQDRDVPSVHEACRRFQKPLNFEMGCHEEMIELAIRERPEWVCLVPESREERTTEGGLDLMNEQNFLRVSSACERIKAGSPTTKISLFVEADEEVLTQALRTQAHAVEIHTGEYARDFLSQKDLGPHLKKYAHGHRLMRARGWGYHAGHGLTLESLSPLLAQANFEEYNIGHWIIAESVFVGLPSVLQEMLALMKKHPLKELGRA